MGCSAVAQNQNREYLKESRVNLKWTQQSQRVGGYAEKSEFGVSLAARWCYELIEWGKHIGWKGKKRFRA
ncbi:hypothetical protein LXL04_037378 [Taraxacum kok-saghyz]